MKIVTIIGARPQFVKAAVLSRQFKNCPGINEVIIHTGQHFDDNMSEIFFRQLDIPEPNFNLNINGLNHGAMTGQMLEKIEELLLLEQPDWVVVYGDTNSTLAGALAAKKLHLKVAHVEAGLRSFNMSMPEEINRIITDRISNVLFCPTDQAIRNLIKEGFEHFDCKLVRCGDVMQEAARFYSDRAQKPGIPLPEKFILCTIHRAENTDNITRLKSIFEAMELITQHTSIVLPLHPRTKSKLEGIGIDIAKSKITFIPPVGYLEMVWLLKSCQMVMTDSGGVQKEAFFFEKFCITLRDETEWIELVENGFNVLAGGDKERIHLEAIKQRSDLRSFDIDLYGNGNVSERIVNELLKR